MSEIITCPAPLDMLRRGSPVIQRERFRYILLTPEPDFEGALCFASPPCNDGEDIDVEWGHVDTLEMDLTDATGRAHAAWWVASRVGIVGNVTSVLTVSVPMGVIWTCLPWPAWLIQTWQCQVDDDHHRRFVQPGNGGLLGDVEVPALAHIDPIDDTRLPDGSRRVDALALKAVVEHLLAEQER